MIPRNQITVHTGSLPDSLPVPAASGRHDRVRVWLVDDDRQISLMMASLLSAEAGFDCSRRFTSAAAMLDALASEIGPEVILLDIQLGPENGLEAIRPIKAIAPAIRVLMLTSFFDRSREEYARNEGASDLLLKSYPIEEIAHRILEALERPPTEITAAPAAPAPTTVERRFAFNPPACRPARRRMRDFRINRPADHGLTQPRQDRRRFAWWGRLAGRLLGRRPGLRTVKPNRKEVMPLSA